MPRILIVDDDPFVLRSLGTALTMEGFSVGTATTVAQAFRDAVAHPADALVIDMQIKGENGLEVLAAMREVWPNRHCPAIVLSGHSERDIVQRAVTAGISDYILKEKFSVERLVEKLRRILKIGPPSGEKPQDSRDLPVAAISQAVSATLSSQSMLNTGLGSERMTKSAPEIPAKANSTALLARIQAHPKMRTFSGAVADVVRLSGSRYSKRADLVRVLQRDPILCVRVITASNEAALIHDRPQVSDVDEAVQLLGFDAVKTLATSIGVFGRFIDGHGPSYHPVQTLQHSLLVASICEKLAPDADNAPSYQLLGLCYLLPEMILRDTFCDEFQAMDLAVARGTPRSAAFASIFAVSYGELAHAALAPLGFPEELVRVIVEAVSADTCSTDFKRAAAVLRLAQSYANSMLIAWDRNSQTDAFGDGELSLLHQQLVNINWRQLRSDALSTVASIVGGMDRSSQPSKMIFSQGYKPFLRIAAVAQEQADPLRMLLEYLGKPLDLPIFPDSAEGWFGANRGICNALPGNEQIIVQRAQESLKHARPEARILIVGARGPSFTVTSSVQAAPVRGISIRQVADFLAG